MLSKTNAKLKNQGSTLLLQINSGKPYNTIDDQTLEEIANQLQNTSPSIRSVVLWGGEHHFAVGANLNELAKKRKTDLLQDPRKDHWQKIASFEKPLIAAVNGLALGAGNELVMHCDIVVSGENSKFGQPEINLGLIPGAGGTQRLVRLVGKSVAMEMILTGKMLLAEEAYRLGFVSSICPPELTLEHALKIAQKINLLSPLTVKTAKSKVLEAFETPLSQGLKSEYQAFCDLAETHDRQEGIRAFLEKRPADFKGN